MPASIWTWSGGDWGDPTGSAAGPWGARRVLERGEPVRSTGVQAMWAAVIEAEDSNYGAAASSEEEEIAGVYAEAK